MPPHSLSLGTLSHLFAIPSLSLLTNLLTQTKASRTLLVRDAFFQKPPLTRIVPPLLSPLKNARRSRTPRFLRCSKTIVRYARFCSAVSLRQKRIACLRGFHVHSFDARLTPTCTYSETCLNPTYTYSKAVSRAAQPNLHSGRLRPLLQVAARICDLAS